MARFPKDNAAALKKFYGDPATAEPGRQLVTVKPPFTLYYGPKKVKEIAFHAKAAPALDAVFRKIWAYYCEDQATLDKLEISNYSGAYAPRLVRGSKTKWSNHAYGAAYDMDAVGNELGKTRGTIPYPVIAAFKSEGFSWGGDYKGRKDPMHFEACDRGEPEWTFEQWLAHYHCPPPACTLDQARTAPKPAPVAPVAPKPAPVPKPKPVPAPAPAPAPADRYDTDQPSPPQPAPAPAARDKYDMGQDEPAVIRVTPPPATVQPGVYSIEVEVIQRMLDQVGYKNVGEIDGRFGGATRGAIAAFMNDRGIAGQANITPQLKAELEAAINEGWRRPIAVERAKATAKELEQKLPEVQASATAERAGFWASIATGASALLTGIAKASSEAVDTLAPIKNFLGEVPWYFWVGGALALSVALYYISRKSKQAKDDAVQAYNEGART